MNNSQNKKEKGFVLVFVIAVVSALSIMTGAMFFYYDTDLKSVSRNSVMQQVHLAAETGLQEGQKWITDQLNSNSFSLVDIQNNLHVDDSDNKCLNRHGFTNSNQDVYYAKKIAANLGSDDKKFEDMSYEVFIQRHADVVRSIYFQGVEARNSTVGTDYANRSFALVENFKDFPTDQFTIEMWIKNMKAVDDSNYNMHAFEWGREWDLVFKVLDDRWSPRLGEKVLGGSGTVGTPVKQQWAHIAWVWDGGTPGSTDTGNVRIYQDGDLVGTYNADIGARAKSGYTNPPEILPEGDHWPLAIGEGLHGFTLNSYINGEVKIQGVPWKGNISEMRIWNISRTETDIANNNRKRLTGSEPGLVSYYKFNEGSGNKALDYNTSRGADRVNDATIYGIGNKGTLWKTELVKYPVVSTVDDTAPSINVPPGEDVVYYKILSCGKGPQNQIVPLELIVSAPVQKGDVGDGKISLTPDDLNDLTGQEGTPIKTSLSSYIAQDGVDGDIKIQTKKDENTNKVAFKRSMEQCENSNTFTDFSNSSSYSEKDCVEFKGKLYYLEKDDGISAGDGFNEEDWAEVLGSGCDGIQFKSASGDESYGHYYKYFSTAPNVTSPSAGDLGYDRDSIDWWEAKRRAEQSTCGGMRGYLVSIESAAENEFIKDAVMCDNSTDSGCTGVTPFHVAAGETRANYYGTRLDGSDDQHYIWLSNSDWREPTSNAANMRVESGPNMGVLVSEINDSFTSPWQSGEPNNWREPYADMEINRNNRDDGEWNDLRRIPNCHTGGLDCITGYIVEYGGYDYFNMTNANVTDENDPKYLDDDTKVCVARATIEKDKYVGKRDLNDDGDTNDEGEGAEDYLLYVSDAEDAPSDISADTSSASDSDTSDDYDGWNVNTGVLTLVHDDKPADWNPNTNYSADAFVWYNNRVWKNVSDAQITGGTGLKSYQTPTVYNPEVWELYSGNEDDAPCGDLEDWTNAFESIRYDNTKAVGGDGEGNPYAYEDGGTLDAEDEKTSPSLGERVILFSLGPLHVHKHLDGYNHFYEFYKFPVRASGTQNLYNNNNRRFNEGFQLSNRLHYLSKAGYLGTITSEEESDILTDKAKGNGWLGGIVSTENQDTWSNLDTCGGPRFRSSRKIASEDWLAFTNIADWPIIRADQEYLSNEDYDNSSTNTPYLMDVERIVSPWEGNGSADHNTSDKVISSITASADDLKIVTTTTHDLFDDDVIHIFRASDDTTGFGDLEVGYYRVVVTSTTEFKVVDLITRENLTDADWNDTYTANTAELRELQGLRTSYYRLNTHVATTETTLSANINAAQNTIGLSDISGFPNRGTVIIDDELITYTGINSSGLTGADRGRLGTTGATHNSGASVSLHITAHNSQYIEDNLDGDLNATDTNIDLDDSARFPSAQDQLDGTIAAGDTTLIVDSTLGFPENGMIQVGNEIMFYQGITSTTLTNVTRGIYRTTAVAHADNANVSLLNVISIGNELITYTGVNDSSDRLTGATRGALGTTASSHSDDDAVSFSNLKKIWQGPNMVWASGSGNTRTNWVNSGTSTDTQCPRWRWATGPEQFIWNHRGLTFSPTRKADNTPSANNGSWTRSASTGGPSGQQIGELFEDGMPFRNFNGSGSGGEPNNVGNTEPALHMLGDHFNASSRYKWNDLHNWSRPHGDSYGIRGLILEYGGMENDGDSRARIATKRVIKLYDRRVTKAIVRIKTGAKTGDKLVVGSDQLTDLGITATNNETTEVTLTGDARCVNYLDLIKSMHFEHDASQDTAGNREIEVLIGDVQKPSGAEHYYQLNDNGQKSYEQANFQASYANLCGIQGYLANVTTTADLDAIKQLGVSNDKQAWVNGTDECQGGIFRSGFWRYTSGPLKDKEFWRVRIDSTVDIESQAACNETSLRNKQSSVRVGPFASANWVSSHPAANNNNYLAFQQTANSSTTGILTRSGDAHADVEGFIIRYGGSVGDFEGADIEEDDNNIDVLLGPIRAEVSFFNDGSQNSIFISDEDSVKIDTSGDISLSSGWTKTDFVAGSNTPLKILPPSNQVISIAEWREELEKVYYQSTDTDDFTPGNRKIKIKLVYTDSALNEEIGIIKTIGSRNAVTVTPISWNNR